MTRRRWVLVVVAVTVLAGVGGLAYRAYEGSRERGEQAERDFVRGQRWNELLRKRDSSGLTPAEAAELERMKQWFRDGMPDDNR